MTLVDAIGLIAAILGTASALPQLVRLIRTSNSAGLSMPLWQLTAGAIGSWTVHGFLVASPLLIISNALLFLLSLAIVVLVCRDQRRPLPQPLALTLLLTVGLAAVDLGFGPVAYGVVVAVPAVVGQLSALRAMRRSPDLTGVSAGFLALNTVVQALWFTWGLLTPDWAIVVCAGALGSLSFVNLCYWAWRRRHGPPAGITAADARAEQEWEHA